MKWRRGPELSMTLPPLTWLLLLFVIPTLMVVSLAFRPGTAYGGVEDGWTLDTLAHLLTPYLWKLTWRSIWISVLSTGLCLIIGIPMAYTVARTSKNKRSLLLLLIILPFWISFIIRIFAWKALLHPEGILKQTLVALHLVGQDSILLYSPWSVVSLMVYSYLPFAILPLYSAASDFDFKLCEAAMDLGLSQTKTFWKIFIPGIMTGIRTAVLMVFVPAVGAYVIPDVAGGPSSEMIGSQIVQKALVERNLPEACALSMLLAFAVLIPILLFSSLKRSRLRLVARNVE